MERRSWRQEAQKATGGVVAGVGREEAVAVVVRIVVFCLSLPHVRNDDAICPKLAATSKK